MPTVILCLILLLFVLFSIKSFLKRMSSGCCGGGDPEYRKSVKDKNKTHYPFTATLKIDGMSCKNCALHVENALNELEGVWAKVNLDKQSATVLMKSKLSDEQMARPILAAGYSVREICRTDGNR